MATHHTDNQQTVKAQTGPSLRTFGERVEFARKSAKLTKQSLEEMAGLARGYVSRITRGQQGGVRPSGTTIASLARALDVDDAWLLTGAGRGPGGARAPSLYSVQSRPNLEQATTILRRDGQVSPEAVAHVREATVRLGELDLGTWIQVLADVQRRR